MKTPYSLAGLALLSLAMLATSVALGDDIDDFVAEMKKVEKTWEKKEKRSKDFQEIYELGEKRFPDRLYRDFAGVFYHVTYKKLGDQDWHVPGMPYTTEQTFDKRGPQIRGWWSDGEEGSPEDQVSCVVVSFEYGTPVAFESLELEVDPKDQKALVTAYHTVALTGLAEVPEPAEGEDPKKPTGARKVALADRKACKPAKKKKIGKVCQYFAATQGLVTATGERERREWYTWTDRSRNATFVLFVRIHESALASKKSVAKGLSFAKAISDGG